MDKKQVTDNFPPLSEAELVAINGGTDFFAHMLDIITGKARRQ